MESVITTQPTFAANDPPPYSDDPAENNRLLQPTNLEDSEKEKEQQKKKRETTGSKVSDTIDGLTDFEPPLIIPIPVGSSHKPDYTPRDEDCCVKSLCCCCYMEHNADGNCCDCNCDECGDCDCDCGDCDCDCGGCDCDCGDCVIL